MNRKHFKEYKKDNPYHVWVKRADGSRFVGHFKNRRDALRWDNSRGVIGKETSAGNLRAHRRKKSRGLFDFDLRI